MSIEEVADYLQRNMGTVSRFENGIYPVRRPDMLAMLDLYGVNEPRHRDNLIKLSESVWQTGWWDGFPDEFEEFVDFVWLEGQAVEHMLFDNTVLPGLLQTRAYAEAAIRTAEYNSPESFVRQGVELRLARQRLLEAESPPVIRSVLDEALLHRCVGSPGVMKEQLRHLVDLAGRPAVHLRVLPFSAGAHESPTGAFNLFRMVDPYPEVAYVETPKGALYIEASDTGAIRQIYDRLWNASLTEEASVEFISRLIEESK
ncbi:hypothetical protein HNR23_001374 [Nocardiopsis mwathae]|uniref:DUF5753 domain-containing protein n=2 Tax=Nocardiopsis mwathae TaxID=1472723 RepID=A0A7W9YFV9_9ACTN|nr:hypothetical protein [Nocardiopsis mwathae]